MVAVLFASHSFHANAAPLATTTTMAVKANGQAVASVSQGTLVTLTATVDVGTTPVTVGTVDFCESTAQLCTGIHRAGSAQLISTGTAKGTASIQIHPAPGQQSYYAKFAGTPYGTEQLEPSNSSQVSLFVNAMTTTTIVSSGSAGYYTLYAYVAGSGGKAAPTGTVSFVDTTLANTVLGSGLLGTGVVAQTFGAGSTLTTDSNPSSVLAGDFNGNGNLDIAVVNYNSNTLSVFMGNGDGTFSAPVDYATGNNPSSVAMTDFNGDGIPDLAVANYGSNTVSVFLGNGDGTFKPQVTFATGAGPESVAVGDFNRDGIPDLAVANKLAGTVSVLFGNGGGTFNPQVAYDVGTEPCFVAVVDSGSQNLAVANYGDNTISILLNYGNGAFNPQTTYSTGNGPVSIAVADFNGDGVSDLAVTNYGGGTISVFLGTGLQTYNPQVVYSTGANPYGISVGDFNGDGNPDLAVASYGEVTVFLGHGDGTFKAQTPYGPLGLTLTSIAVGDFNGDGIPDLSVTDYNRDAAYVLLDQLTSTATASTTGISVIDYPAGTMDAVDAQYPGDSLYLDSTSQTIQLTAVTPPSAPTFFPPGGTYTASQTVTISDTTPRVTIYYTTNGATPTTSSSVYSGPISVSASETIEAIATASGYSSSAVATAAYTISIPVKTTPTVMLTPSSSTITTAQALSLTVTLSGTPAPTGTVMLTGGGYVSAATVLTSGSATINVSAGALAVGGDTLTASYTPDSSSSSIYYTATGSAPITVTKAPQTITFPAITGTQYALTQLTLSATASSGLAVSYTSTTTTVCTVSGSTLSLLVPGTCVLHAAQAGNSDYLAAPTLAQSFAVHAVPQTITFPAITGTQYALSQLTLSATTSSGLAVSYTSTTPTVCTVSGSTASLLIAGTCVVDAAQAGNSIYAAAPTVAQSFAVHLVAQKMTFPAITQTPFALTQITLVATATSGLPVTITSITPTVCTVSGFTASLLVPGTCVLHAAQAGNSDYSPAPTLAQDFTVVKAQQSITFPAITGTQYALSKVTLTATATSGLAVTYTSTTPTVCTVSGSTASLLAPGTCVLHANQAGNTLYAAASMVAQSFSVHLIAQTITFPAITGTQYAGSQLTLTATATSGLAVAYTSTTTTVCTVSGNTASLLTAGTCVLHAAQAGNSDYAAAPALAQSFAVKAAAAN
jgi:ribosomal protein S11